MMVFQNLYYKRTAATAKACYVCYKPTVIVLATIDTTDFFYICLVHLTDRGFTTRAPDPEPEPKKPAVSPEEVARVKQEWEEKQHQKKEKAEKKKKSGQVNEDGKKGAEGEQKDAEGKEGDVGGTKADHKQEMARKPADTIAVANSSESTSRPTHERRRQAAQTKDLAPRLPGAPSSSLS